MTKKFWTYMVLTVMFAGAAIVNLIAMFKKLGF